MKTDARILIAEYWLVITSRLESVISNQYSGFSMQDSVCRTPHETFLPTQFTGDVERHQHHPAARPGLRPAHHLRHYHAPARTGPEFEAAVGRSEERRVGKECRSRWSPY